MLFDISQYLATEHGFSAALFTSPDNVSDWKPFGHLKCRSNDGERLFGIMQIDANGAAIASDMA
jgi:hypothetical protein